MGRGGQAGADRIEGEVSLGVGEGGGVAEAAVVGFVLPEGLAGAL